MASSSPWIYKECSGCHIIRPVEKTSCCGNWLCFECYQYAKLVGLCYLPVDGKPVGICLEKDWRLISNEEMLGPGLMFSDPIMLEIARIRDDD